MANTITGRIRKITPVQEITGKSGNTFAKRILVLDAACYDTHTGEKKYDNYPSFEFSGEAMNILDNFNEGDAVTVSYDINGREPFKIRLIFQDKDINSINILIECLEHITGNLLKKLCTTK